MGEALKEARKAVGARMTALEQTLAETRKSTQQEIDAVTDEKEKLEVELAHTRMQVADLVDSRQRAGTGIASGLGGGFGGGASAGASAGGGEDSEQMFTQAGMDSAEDGSGVLVGGEGEDQQMGQARLAQLQLELENAACQLEDQREYYEKRLRRETAQAAKRAKEGKGGGQGTESARGESEVVRFEAPLEEAQGGRRTGESSAVGGVLGDGVSGTAVASELMAVEVELSYTSLRLQQLLQQQQTASADISRSNNSSSNSSEAKDGVYISKQEQDELRHTIMRMVQMRLSASAGDPEMFGLLRSLRYNAALGFGSAESSKQHADMLRLHLQQWEDCADREATSANESQIGDIIISSGPQFVALSRASERELQAVQEVRRLRWALKAKAYEFAGQQQRKEQQEKAQLVTNVLVQYFSATSADARASVLSVLGSVLSLNKRQLQSLTDSSGSADSNNVRGGSSYFKSSTKKSLMAPSGTIAQKSTGTGQNMQAAGEGGSADINEELGGADTSARVVELLQQKLLKRDRQMREIAAVVSDSETARLHAEEALVAIRARATRARPSGMSDRTEVKAEGVAAAAEAAEGAEMAEVEVGAHEEVMKLRRERDQLAAALGRAQQLAEMLGAQEGREGAQARQEASPAVRSPFSSPSVTSVAPIDTPNTAHGHTVPMVYRLLETIELTLREQPDVSSAKTSYALAPGSVFEVHGTKIVPADSGPAQTYLYVVNGEDRGWAFVLHPTTGVPICKRWSAKQDYTQLKTDVTSEIATSKKQIDEQAESAGAAPDPKQLKSLRQALKDSGKLVKDQRGEIKQLRAKIQAMGSGSGVSSSQVPSDKSAGAGDVAIEYDTAGTGDVAARLTAADGTTVQLKQLKESMLAFMSQPGEPSLSTMTRLFGLSHGEQGCCRISLAQASSEVRTPAFFRFPPHFASRPLRTPPPRPPHAPLDANAFPSLSPDVRACARPRPPKPLRSGEAPSHPRSLP
jgi:hypothetical protein